MGRRGALRESYVNPYAKKRTSKANFKPNPKYSFESKLERWNNLPPAGSSNSPGFNAAHFIKIRKMYLDAVTNFVRLFEHDQLLKKNFKALMTQGSMKNFKEKERRELEANLHAIKLRLENHMRENLILFGKIYHVPPEIKKTSPKILTSKEQQLEDYKKFKVPEKILSKYENMKFPCGLLLFKLLRPRIWFELELLRVPPGQGYVGRINIELFTEAAPLVVKEFVQCCASGNVDRIRFLRLFPNLWLEGEVDLPQEHRLREGAYEYDMRALSHNKPGIVSFPKNFIKQGFNYGIMSFTISSRPLPVLNGKRVAIGRLVDSIKVIELLQDYGTKNGKLSKQLKVTSTGVYY